MVVDRSEPQVEVASQKQGSHMDQKLLSSVTPPSCKLPLHLSLNHPLNKALEESGKFLSLFTIRHCGSLGLAVGSYGRRMVFRGPLGSCLPPPNPSLSPTFNPFMVSHLVIQGLQLPANPGSEPCLWNSSCLGMELRCSGREGKRGPQMSPCTSRG